MNIQQIDNKIEELQKQKQKLIEKQKLEQQTDFQEIKHKGKTFRVYKWENKPFKDFPIPEGFRWCEALDLIILVNEKKLIGEKDCSYYSNKLFKESYWELFRAYLDRNGDWNSDDGGLANSNDGGRVVVSK